MVLFSFYLNLYTVKCTGLGLVLQNLTKGQKSCNHHQKQVRCFHDLKNFPGMALFLIKPSPRPQPA